MERKIALLFGLFGAGFVPFAGQAQGVEPDAIVPEQASAPPAVPAAQGESQVAPAEARPVQRAEPPYPETGWLCRDGVDNNSDGKVDCHELSCQGSRYCKHKVLERPLAPSTKAPGLLLSLGGGVASSHLWASSEKLDTNAYGTVPFEPDFGWQGNIQVGALPLKWLGFGVDWQFGKTKASNKSSSLGAPDDDSYRYLGEKRFRAFGPFVRLQAPLGRFVPYVDSVFTWSRSKTRLELYDPDNKWADIEDWYNDPREDRSTLIGEQEVQRKAVRQFGFAVQPGFDVFVVPQSFAIGAKAILPLWASKSLADQNFGALLTLTFTPSWRERSRLKAEYAPPAK